MFQLFFHSLSNKTGLEPVEVVHYFGEWVEGASKQTDRTDGWVQSTFGCKAEQRSRQTDRTGSLKNLPNEGFFLGVF